MQPAYCAFSLKNSMGGKGNCIRCGNPRTDSDQFDPKRNFCSLCFTEIYIFFLQADCTLAIISLEQRDLMAQWKPDDPNLPVRRPSMDRKHVLLEYENFRCFVFLRLRCLFHKNERGYKCLSMCISCSIRAQICLISGEDMSRQT